MRQLSRETLGPAFSEGARLLWSALKARGLEQSDARHALKAPMGMVNKWLYGERRPGLAWALKLEKEFGIDPKRWREEPTEPFVPPGALDVEDDEEPRPAKRTGTMG